LNGGKEIVIPLGIAHNQLEQSLGFYSELKDLFTSVKVLKGKHRLPFILSDIQQHPPAYGGFWQWRDLREVDVT
jgi:hypothetical protein